MNPVSYEIALSLRMRRRFVATLLRLGSAIIPGAASGLLTVSVAAQPGPAVFSGRVFNSATGAALEGARVELNPGGRFVLTGPDGRFQSSALPPGEYTVTATYTGLDPQTAAIALAAGQVQAMEIGLTSEVYRMSAFVVAGEREGSALAITQQRNAPNIKNVLAADAFGSIAKANIGNFLQRIPGIVGEQGEVDVTEVSVRGMDPALSEVTIDGELAANAQPSSSSRSVRVDALQAQYVRSVEVTKAPTPDMSAASAGGMVNLITKSAFDTKDAAAGGYSVGFIYDQTFGEGPDPSANVYYSRVFGAKNNLGLFLTANRDEVTTTRSSTNKELMPNWDFASPYWHYWNRSAYDIHNQIRTGASAKLDFKWSDASSFKAGLSYTQYADDMFRNRSVFTGVQNRIIAQRDANGIGRNEQGQEASIVPGFTELRTELERVRYQIERETRDRVFKTWKADFGGRHTLADLKLDYDVSYSWSDGTEGRERLTGTSNNRFNYTHDRSNSFHWPRIVITGGVDPAAETFANAQLTTEARAHAAEDEVFGASANAQRRFDATYPSFVKVGARVRSQRKERDDNFSFWTFNPTDASEFLDRGWDEPPAGGKYPLWPQLGVREIFDDIRTAPARWTYNDRTSLERTLRDDVVIEETIAAAYVMGNVDFRFLSMLGGVRYERTEVEGDAPLVNTRAATIAERYAQRTTTTGAYDKVFPGIHVKSQPRKGLVLRASYTTSIGRPGFGNIIATTNVDELNQTVSQNNPALLPQYVTNFDASIEQYFEPASLVSVGVFRKDIEDYITSTTRTIGTGADNGFGGEYAGWELRTNANGGTGKVKGIEFSFIQQFSFLPGRWRGFGLFANYTYLETEGNFGGSLVRQTGQIPGFKPRVGNLGISYSFNRWSARVQANYVGNFLESLSSDASNNNFGEERTVVDINTRFALTSRLNLYCDIANAFEADKRTFRGSVKIPGRERETQMQGMTISAGITGRF